MKVADIAPLDIEDADDALLARAEEYPRRPFNDDPHFLAVLEELEETMGFHLISACDESLEVKVGIGGDREVRLRIVESADADSGGAVPVVRQDSPSATADVAVCKTISARRDLASEYPGT